MKNIEIGHGLKYDIKLIVLFFFLIISLAYIILFALQNYLSSSLFSFYGEDKKIYFLHSSTLERMYESQNMDYEEYQKRIASMQNLCEKYDFNTQIIDVRKLDSIAPNSTLLVFDMMALSKFEIDAIDTFVSNGGKILFNFTSGFQNPSLKYEKNNLVHRITGLKLHQKHNMVKFSKDDSASLTLRLLSPLAKYLSTGRGLSVPLYDPLPIFDTDIKPDAYMTNWVQTRYPNINDRQLSDKQSGLIWHGVKGKGKWVYFSFPSYVFVENQTSEYQKLFHGMLAYLEQKAVVQMYPYIDTKNVVFISEDTEYKFENLNKFNTLSKIYKFPVTAFCVAKLANSNTSLMKRVGKNRFLEIGSHSFSHKKIVGQSKSVYEKETLGSKKVLERYAHNNIMGFRPPREELDDILLQSLEDANYKYILGASDNQLYPFYKKGILVIPKHGTDDYAYLVSLDYNFEQIVQAMKQELETVTNLNGIYTLSTHTHLLNYGKNSQILDNLVQYIQKSPTKFYPMNGSMIFHRMTQYHKLHLDTEFNKKSIILTIDNSNESVVKQLHYQITVDPTIELKNVESEMFGFKSKLIKKSQTTYILILEYLNAKSRNVLFINYVQNT